MNFLKELKEKAIEQQSHEAASTEELAKQVPLISAYQTAEERGAMLAAIVDSSDDAIISKDLSGIVTSWNKSAERIFGYSAMEMIGASILKLIPEDRAEEEPAILSKLRNGYRVDHFQTKRRRKDGGIIDVSLTISPVKNQEGKIIGVSKIARDITDWKLEEQRKNDFIAIVSHELKTPLTSIKSYVQLALTKARERSDKFSENVLTRAELQTKKMTTMIHDFLNLSRLEEGKMSLSLQRFHLPELMEEIISDALIYAPEHHLDYTGCPPIELYADRDKVGQVMTNIINNAAKYSSPGSVITIHCQLQDDHIHFSFRDQGVGISPDDHFRLFQRFYRVKNDASLGVSGFGIGLYLVAEILKLHGSTVQVSSIPGQGSTFSFSLPIAL